VGRKLLYIYGFGVFIVGSALCGFAPNLAVLDSFRVLQAVGAAMLQANSVAIIALAMPRDRLGRGIGVQGAAQALGLALGPSAGGLLIALGGWRLIFFVNVPVGIVGALLGWFFIPRSRDLRPRHRVDWVGLGLLLPAVVALLYAISFGDANGWGSPGIIGPLAASLVLAAAFIAREGHTPRPVLDLSLFRRIPFSAGVLSGLLSYVVMFGTLLAVPFYLERSLRLGAGITGLELTTVPVALGVVAVFAGRAADRFGARPLTVCGMLLSAAMLALLATGHPSGAGLLLPLAGLGAGLGLFVPPNNAAIMGSAPRHHAGAASGVLNMTRGLGTAMGLAFTGLVLDLGAGVNATAGVGRGFTDSVVFLALVALAAAAVAAMRGGGELALHRAPGAD
jgi:EmrB/QacA subfamily drug resistance transporter